VRFFVEMGPGASCTRMIGAILGDRPHRARSVCAPGADGVSAVLRLLGQLIAERFPVDLSPLYGRDAVRSVGVEEKTSGRSLVIPIGGEPFSPPPVPCVRGPASPCETTTTGKGRESMAPQSHVSPSAGTTLVPLLDEAVAAGEAHGQAH